MLTPKETLFSMDLADYDISPSRGFLPDLDPLLHLPYSYIFSPLEHLAMSLPKLLAAGALRQKINDNSQHHLKPLAHNARQLTQANTQTSPVLRRTKLIMDYLGQAYVWGEDPPAQEIPEGFAEFWYQVSERCSLPPVLSYSSYALHNWSRIDPTGPIALGNIAVQQNFLGGLDEDWFILIHIDIEQKASAIPSAALGAFKALADGNSDQIEHNLSVITAALENMLATLNRMTEYCDPSIYYMRVRPYLHGWKNNKALPNGLLYKGVAAYKNRRKKFRGESGAQSSIVPTLVASLDVRHKESIFTPYLKEMRNYMPPSHRCFIQDIEYVSHNGYSLREYAIDRKQKEPALYKCYRECRKALWEFRRKHYEYVGRYIHSQAERHTGNPTAVGTAGTPFMISLKQLLDETAFP